MRSRECMVSAGLQKQFKRNTFTGSISFRSVDILDDTARFVSKVYSYINDDVFLVNKYASLDLNYSYVYLNDSVVPTKGITFLANATYTYNFAEKDPFQKYFARMQTYLPLAGKFSLAIKAGVSTIAADDEDIINSAQFYQHAVIGVKGFGEKILFIIVMS